MSVDLKSEGTTINRGLVGLIVGVVIGLGIGYFVFNSDIKSHVTIAKQQPQIIDKLPEDNYLYLNPSIAYLDFSSIDLTTINGMDSILSEQIEEAKKDGKINSAAIYYRDMITNQKVGINESEIFSPGSLMKVPIMIAIFKYAEMKPHILNQKLKYQISKEAEYLESKNKNARSNSKLINGSEYTVAQLVDIMIVESDNEATILLIDFIDGENSNFLSKVEEELGMIIPDGIDFNENFLTIRTYASFFRVLYNSSYLEKEYSEMALEILSKTGYGYGIRQSIPKEVVVAHKYGIKPSKDKFVQLHHFGIVYHEKKPFLIGIMTKGKDVEKLKSFIADITTTAYQRINERSTKLQEMGYKRDLEN